jgi:hypothetical protein
MIVAWFHKKSGPTIGPSYWSISKISHGSGAPADHWSHWSRARQRSPLRIDLAINIEVREKLSPIAGLFSYRIAEHNNVSFPTDCRKKARRDLMYSTSAEVSLSFGESTI